MFNVVPMCRQGVRQSAAELRAAMPITGLLVIEDWRDGNAENRALRVARLRHPTQSHFPELLLPMFDPVLVRCDHRGMVLVGIECDVRPGGEVARVMQQWWLRASAGVKVS